MATSRTTWPRRAQAALGLLLLGGALACGLLGLSLRAGLARPPLLRVALGGAALDTTIENRVCLQRMLHRACRPPVYTLRLSYDSPAGTQYYRLARLQISERFAFYP
jgi:hypothetical protein